MKPRKQITGIPHVQHFTAWSCQTQTSSYQNDFTEFTREQFFLGGVRVKHIFTLRSKFLPWGFSKFVPVMI